MQTTAPPPIAEWHCGQRGTSSTGAIAISSAAWQSASNGSSSAGGDAGAGAGATAATGFAGGFSATAAARLGAGGEPEVDDLAADDRAVAPGCTAGFESAAVDCCWAVAAPITTEAPHTGQRAFFPSVPAGALSFFPQAQRNRIDGAAVMIHHPFVQICRFFDWAGGF